MQYQHVGHKIKGFYYWIKYLQRYLTMLSAKAQQIPFIGRQRHLDKLKLLISKMSATRL